MALNVYSITLLNRCYNEFRQTILEKSREEYEKESGVFKLDESYFGAKKFRGKSFAKCCHTVAVVTI